LCRTRRCIWCRREERVEEAASNAKTPKSDIKEKLERYRKSERYQKQTNNGAIRVM
jgi:hypothetical protein